jgi:hypothetical protein
VCGFTKRHGNKVGGERAGCGLDFWRRASPLSNERVWLGRQAASKSR